MNVRKSLGKGPMVAPIINIVEPSRFLPSIARDEIHRCTFGHQPAYLAAGGVACYRCGVRLR